MSARPPKNYPTFAVLLVCGCALLGCAKWRAPTWPFSSGGGPLAVADQDADFVQRTSLVEDRYRGEEVFVEKKKDASFFDKFSPEAIGSSLKKAVGQGPKPSIARRYFAEAEVLYARANAATGEERTRLFQAAGDKYQAAAERWPASILAEDSWFMAGEGYFFADNYPEARVMYDALTKNFPNTRHLDVVDAHRFAMAQFWLAQSDETHESWYDVNLFDNTRPWHDSRSAAYKVFDRIRLDDPTGKLADDATIASANAHFLAGDFLGADDLYTDLRKSFPSSEHQFDAHFLGLKTKLACYNGPDYSDDALDQAELLIKQIRKQFPDKASQQKEYLDRAYAELRFRRAERLWSLGRYYELQAAYGASNLQYQKLVDEYPESPFAAPAAEAIRANADKPPVPPQPLESVVKLFPQRKIAKPLIPNDEPTSVGGKRR